MISLTELLWGAALTAHAQTELQNAKNASTSLTDLQ
jgi:hypothetical protein